MSGLYRLEVDLGRSNNGLPPRTAKSALLSLPIIYPPKPCASEPHRSGNELRNILSAFSGIRRPSHNPRPLSGTLPRFARCQSWSRNLLTRAHDQARQYKTVGADPDPEDFR